MNYDETVTTLCGLQTIVVPELREALIEARDWIDSMGDFMARPTDLLAQIDRVLATSARYED